MSPATSHGEGARDGQCPQNHPACPILDQAPTGRPLVSSWRTYFPHWRRAQGTLGSLLRQPGEWETSQLPSDPPTVGLKPFSEFFFCCIPKARTSAKGISSSERLMNPPCPKPWALISFYTLDGMGHVRRKRQHGSCVRRAAFVTRFLWIVCNYV